MKRLLATFLMMLSIACSEQVTEPSTDRDAAAAPTQATDEDAGLEPVEARDELTFDSDGEGGGLAAQCSVDTTYIDKAKHTMNQTYACNPNTWQNGGARIIEQWNSSCWYNGKQRYIKVRLLDQPNGNCRYYIYRSKSGPTSSTCYWYQATCQPAYPNCVLTTYTGNNNCFGYN